MNNKLFGPFLDDKAVLATLHQHTAAVISLAALDCNWADDGNEGIEKDYFNLWAAVSFYETTDRVFLQGARFSNWNIEYELKLVSKEKSMGLYRLSLDNAGEFPNEFVLRLERETGECIYDNNNFRNYFIERGKGHFATAISSEGNVFSFESIIPVNITSY
ncbi:hypothetical protein R83H12_03069 [Fibrobacteria bacterium R8-3-H12]